MPVAFRELAAEDPSLRIEHDADTGQVVLWTTGPAHLDLVLGRLRSRFNVGVEQVPVRVAMKETAVTRAEAQGRHVKQSGGHGQFAVCHLVDGAAAPRVRHRVRRGRGRRRRAAPVLQQRREGRAPPARAGAARRLAGRRRQGDPHRRQGALGRLLRRRVPDRRGAGPARAGLTVDDVPARADRHGDRHRRRRLPRRGDDRHRHPPRPDHRLLRRRGPAGPLGARGRRAAARAARLRHHPAVTGPRHGTFHREHRGYEQLPDRLAKDHVGERAGTADGPGPARRASAAGLRVSAASWASSVAAWSGTSCCSDRSGRT